MFIYRCVLVESQIFFAWIVCFEKKINIVVWDWELRKLHTVSFLCRYILCVGWCFDNLAFLDSRILDPIWWLFRFVKFPQTFFKELFPSTLEYMQYMLLLR